MACLLLTTGAEAQNSKWRELASDPDFFHKMALLRSLGQDLHERAAVLSRLHKMWTTDDVLRRPEIAYLMCQFGDRSEVEAVATAFFAGDYDTGRELEPDGSAAGANATDDAFRTLILYGTPQHRRRLLALLKLSDDPLRKRDSLCQILPGAIIHQQRSGAADWLSQRAIPLGACHRLLGLHRRSGDDSFCAWWLSAVANWRAAGGNAGGFNYCLWRGRRVPATGLRLRSADHTKSYFARFRSPRQRLNFIAR